MSCASSTTSRSFASCTSRRDRIAGVDAGEAALRADREAVESTVARRVLDARASVRPYLPSPASWSRSIRARPTCACGTKPQRREITRARRVVFEEIERDVQRIEQPLGDVLVAALGVPLAAAVAAAQMHADPHGIAARARSTRLVTAMYLSMSALQSSPRAFSCCLHVGIAELGEGGLVDLHVAAAGLGQRA